MFTDTISNEVKLRKLKDAIINIICINKDQIKLQHSDQEPTENFFALHRKEIQLLKHEIKKKEDLIKTLLDTINVVTAAKSQPVTKPVLSFVDDSASNADLNRSTSIEKIEPRSKQLTQEIRFRRTTSK